MRQKIATNIVRNATLSIFIIINLIFPLANSIELTPLNAFSVPYETVIYKEKPGIIFSESIPHDTQYLKIRDNEVMFIKSELSDYEIGSMHNKLQLSPIQFLKSEPDDKLFMTISRIDEILMKNFKITIFMYHRFVDIPRNPYEISVHQFEEEMRYLYENGYKTITLGEYIDAVYNKNLTVLPAKPVIITVDDGYRSFLTRAYPILKKYGFTATLFIYTNFISNGSGALTWEELRELHREGIEIGSHSLSHPNMANPKHRGYMNYDRFLEDELGRSREIIEREIGVRVRTFAWPYGSYNQTAIKKAIELGYEGLVTVKPGSMTINSDPLHIRRYGVYPSTSLELFALRLKMPPNKVVFSTEEIADMEMTSEGEYILKKCPTFCEDLEAIDDSYSAIFEALEELNSLESEEHINSN